MLSLEDVENHLTPYHDDIYSSIEEALERYQANPDRSYMSKPRTMKNVLWEMATGLLMERLQHKDGVSVIEEQESRYFNVGNGLVFRIKSVDQDGNSRNFPTTRNSQYVQCQLQELFQQIDTVPSSFPLEVGYELDAHGLALKGVYVKYFPLGQRYEIEKPKKVQPFVPTDGETKRTYTVKGKEAVEPAEKTLDYGN
jgi:hypothetical protein